MQSISASMGSRRATTPLEQGYRDSMRSIIGRYMNFVKTIKREVIPAAMIEALGPTLKLAVKYCPKDTGLLANSAFLEEDTFRGEPRVILGFAKKNDPPYAIFVHEMDYRHRSPTSRKFLERAMNEDFNNFMPRLRGAARRNAANGETPIRRQVEAPVVVEAPAAPPPPRFLRGGFDMRIRK